MDNGLTANNTCLSSCCIWFLYFVLDLWIITGHVGPGPVKHPPDVSSTFVAPLKAALWSHLSLFPFHSDVVLLCSYTEARSRLVGIVIPELKIFFLTQKPRGRRMTTRMTMRKNQTRTLTDVRRAVWVCWPGLQPARFLSAPPQSPFTMRANTAADRALWVMPTIQSF